MIYTGDMGDSRSGVRIRAPATICTYVRHSDPLPNSRAYSRFGLLAIFSSRMRCQQTCELTSSRVRSDQARCTSSRSGLFCCPGSLSSVAAALVHSFSVCRSLFVLMGRVGAQSGPSRGAAPIRDQNPLWNDHPQTQRQAEKTPPPSPKNAIDNVYKIHRLILGNGGRYGERRTYDDDPYHPGPGDPPGAPPVCCKACFLHWPSDLRPQSCLASFPDATRSALRVPGKRIDHHNKSKVGNMSRPQECAGLSFRDD